MPPGHARTDWLPSSAALRSPPSQLSTAHHASLRDRRCVESVCKHGRLTNAFRIPFSDAADAPPTSASLHTQDTHTHVHHTVTANTDTTNTHNNNTCTTNGEQKQTNPLQNDVATAQLDEVSIGQIVLPTLQRTRPAPCLSHGTSCIPRIRSSCSSLHTTAICTTTHPHTRHSQIAKMTLLV